MKAQSCLVQFPSFNGDTKFPAKMKQNPFKSSKNANSFLKKCKDGFRKTAVPPQTLYNAGSLQSCGRPCSLGKEEPDKYLIFINFDV